MTTDDKVQARTRIADILWESGAWGGTSEHAERVADAILSIRVIREGVELKASFAELDRVASELRTPTPDRSGEADETRSGSAEGESGLPEGSSN